MDPFEDYEARLRGHQLGDLRWHWGEAYDIQWADGAFRAARRDTGDVVTGATFGEINRAILADYSRKPVPRGTWAVS